MIKPRNNIAYLPSIGNTVRQLNAPCLLNYFSTLFLSLILLGIPVIAFSQHTEDNILIRRTTYGVPHIEANTLKGAAFGLAWCELEDYGEKVLLPLISARAELSMVIGSSGIEQDFARQLGYQKALANYNFLDIETKALLEGFAEGVNAYLDQHPKLFPEFQPFRFSGVDIAAVNISVSTPAKGKSFVEQLLRRQAIQDSLRLTEAGSNAWAFAPERTKEGHAILVRNPHLSWAAGYYEAHIKVPGKLNFYGDFRIGGLFSIIGGFNEHLGWATTNNYPDLEEVYALKIDPERADYYLLDGKSIPLQRKMLQVAFKNGKGTGLESREMLFTPFGPVIHRERGKIYILKEAGDGVFKRAQQFTHMLLSTNLDEWKEAMRMQAITSSNYTYADAAGNIFYVWNAMTPILNHVHGGDTAAIEVDSLHQIWSQFVPFDELPQLLNPVGGYLHNENDPFHYANLNQILKPEDFPSNFPAPRLRMRSQHSLQLIHNDERFSLEDVVDKKHSMKMLLAEKLKEELIQILYSSKQDRRTNKAIIKHLSQWDNTVAAKSRGGVLFQAWFELYTSLMKNKDVFEKAWDPKEPMAGWQGISGREEAILAMKQAANQLTERYGSWDLSWGKVHRIRHGSEDLPASGGPGGLGCFRVLWFEDAEDGKRKVRGGDGWQLAVSFSDPPKAYSILAYGQTNDPESPHHIDQLKLFADNQMKTVCFAEEDIAANTIKSYRIGKR